MSVAQNRKPVTLDQRAGLVRFSSDFKVHHLVKPKARPRFVHPMTSSSVQSW